MFLQNVLTFFQIISDDGYVATANSKGFFEDMDDKPIWTCQGASCNPLAEAISQAVAHRIPTKLHPKGGGKGKSKGRVQWAPQHTTLYLPSLRGGSNRPPGVVAQETRLHSPFLLQQQISNFFLELLICCGVLCHKWVGEGIKDTFDTYRSYFYFGKGI